MVFRKIYSDFSCGGGGGRGYGRFLKKAPQKLQSVVAGLCGYTV